MPLTDFIRRASTYILGSEEISKNNDYGENEILFCKNNVCVHPPAVVRQETDVLHNPGYLTITNKVFVDQYNDTRRPTLFLTWIPNMALTKRTSSIVLPNELGTVSVLKNSYNNKKQNSMESLTSNDSSISSIEIKNTNPFLSNYEEKADFSSGSESLSSDDGEKNQGTIINVDIAKPDIEIISTPEDTKDILEHLERLELIRSESRASNGSEISLKWLSTPEYLAQKHHLTFPESNSSSPILPTKQPHRCRRFSVDLSQMRSLRLFFSDNSCTCGQLVIASRESQYKILHFHHGGLDHLAQVLHQWHSLLHNVNMTKVNDDNLPYRHFMVCRPEVSELELHPEDGQIPKLTEEMFHCFFNDLGQLEDDLSLRKLVFFSGMEKHLRRQVWPFLLHVYSYQSTYAERSQIDILRKMEYIEITRRRLDLNENQLNQFRRTIQSVVEKDVIRTDRSNPYFAGENNANLEVMKNILLNYAVFNPGTGYTQGMSDLLAPVLCEMQDEMTAFWCFVGLMQRAVFVATPTDRDMDRSLKYLRELVRIMLPNFFMHLEKHKDANELLFCHRWILLCFKREFTEGIALRMWEACWSNYLTDYFHLFLCLAIISVYADDVIAQDLRADEMLLHFSSLAMYMDGMLIIKKARGLLHQFRQLREIPCTLAGLCTKCGPGIWDSFHSPRVYCVGHEKSKDCNTCVNIIQ